MHPDGQPATEVVAIRRRRRSDAAADVLAVWADGHAVLVLEPTTSDRAAAALLELLRPTVLVHERPDGRRRTTRLAGPRPLPGDIAAVVATSGTTGSPSVVALSRQALDASTIAGLRRLAAGPGEVWALCLPLDHVAGLLVLRRALAGTTPAQVHDDFDPGALLDGSATRWALVPTMLHRVIALAAERGVDLAGRHVLLGGSAASGDLLDRARALGARITTSYGMTETCGGCVYDGLPLDGVEVEIARGRIRIRGDVLASGRLPSPSSTSVATAVGDAAATGHFATPRTLVPVADDDGWLATADRGELDEEDRLVVLGRSDDIVVTGGVNVDIHEVAAVIRDSGVTDVVVFGVDDPEWGQRIEAAVVTDRPAPDDWNAAIRARIGPSAVPKDYHQLAAIPRGELGKPDERALDAAIRTGQS